MKTGTFALCATPSLLLLLASAGAGTASARVALVATGMPELAIADDGADKITGDRGSVSG